MQIKASDIDFWSNRDVNMMRLQHNVKMYPPRVKMTITVPVPCGIKKLPVKFEGYLRVNLSLDVELIIPLAKDTAPKSSPPRRCSHERMSCKLLCTNIILDLTTLVLIIIFINHSLRYYIMC